ncbi:MAG: HupE/UreJ family protein [Blastocatellia bacterium]|nr:HupE/UreJ family protein [Blastocatellia bacterium]
MQRKLLSKRWQWRLVLLFLAASIAAQSVYAHQQPVTLVVLDINPKNVAMTIHVPLNELELAFGHQVTQAPETSLARWQSQFSAYLSNHIHPTTNNQPWSVQIGALEVAKAEQTQSGPFQEVIVHLLLTPPTGASTRRFTLHYDAIIHQVVTHKALVSIRHDWEQGQMMERQVGVMQVNTQTTLIEPLEINLETGSWWDGFKGMVSLGQQHIKEGTDHLLFLLALLLPATLRVNGRQWGAFGGGTYSLMRLMKIVTAFTIGHSVTLLVGAMGWLRLPQQPVEVLIAISILVSALHAIRPIFPGHEMYVAAGFGLIHGLAFATVLADLNLEAAPMALSILGFNLGIELMQLFVVAITMPWLTLLSLTPFYKGVRISSAMLAVLAALGWMATRISGVPNAIERAMEAVTQFSPLAVLLLALVAIPTYLYSANKGKTIAAQIER